MVGNEVMIPWYTGQVLEKRRDVLLIKPSFIFTLSDEYKNCC